MHINTLPTDVFYQVVFPSPFQPLRRINPASQEQGNKFTSSRLQSPRQF